MPLRIDCGDFVEGTVTPSLLYRIDAECARQSKNCSYIPLDRSADSENINKQKLIRRIEEELEDKTNADKFDFNNVVHESGDFISEFFCNCFCCC